VQRGDNRRYTGAQERVRHGHAPSSGRLRLLDRGPGTVYLYVMTCGSYDRYGLRTAH
jgi:hypothetical protein